MTFLCLETAILQQLAECHHQGKKSSTTEYEPEGMLEFGFVGQLESYHTEDHHHQQWQDVVIVAP